VRGRGEVVAPAGEGGVEHGRVGEAQCCVALLLCCAVDGEMEMEGWSCEVDVVGLAMVM